MNEYHKINSIYKRDEATKYHSFLEGQFSTPELEFLANNQWQWTEKVDGTNIRVMWNGKDVRFGGKTDNASIPAPLVERLISLFPAAKFQDNYAECESLCLYGEGYGGKIQNGGCYGAVDFVLFDVKIGEWWLYRDGVEDVARKLGVSVVPIVGQGTLLEAVEVTRKGMKSCWGEFPAEGIVARPLGCELRDRRGARIITKIKHKDFV
ncbi:MAG: RNA ligase family protein [Patescibacteria group bacterium]